MDIAYKNLYFVNGPTPQGWARNDIKDGPNGWCNAFVIREQGQMTRVFIPYSCEGWEVDDECFELQKVKEPQHEISKTWMFSCIVRAFDGRKRHGLPTDNRSACDVITWLGMTPPGNMRPETALTIATPTITPDKVSLRASRTGLLTINDACAGLAITPRQARGYLRNAGVQKPAPGWVGDQKWIDSITKTIKAEMVKEAKKKA